MDNGSIALKEWAAAIAALEQGRQIIAMRKGGIVEETRDFQLRSPSFYLYPTFEHQRRELLKDEWQHLVDETMARWKPEQQHADITCFAEAVEDIEVTSQEELDRLRDHHIWTDAFAEERLRWKRSKPLHVLVLRTYRLNGPQRIAIAPDYAGCTSWIRLHADLSQAERKPVLDDAEFARWAAAIKDALNGK